MDMHTEDRFQGLRVVRQRGLSIPGQAYHVSVATRDRQAWFSNFHVGCEAVRAFRQPLAHGDATLLAWVLMPDQVHWLLQVGQRDPLEKVVQRMKSVTGVQVNRVLSRAGPLWEPAFHDRPLRREDDLRTVARYIVAEPLRARLVDDIRDYPFWDCAWV